MWSTQGYAFINKKIKKDGPKPIMSNTPPQAGAYKSYVPSLLQF